MLYLRQIQREQEMTDESNNQEWRDEMDRPEHEKTYEAFLNYSKWGSIAVGIILIFLLVFVYD